MDAIGGLTAYDLVIVGLFILLVGRGIWLGMLKQVTGLLALYFGYFAASRYHEQIFPMLKNVTDNPKVMFLTSYVILFIITYIVIMLIGKGLSMVVQMTITSWFDKLFGALVGFAKAAILAVLLHIVLGTILAPENPMLRTCRTCGALNGAADFTREFIRNEEVRKSLLQQQPAISLDAVKNYLAPADE
ncbi:CvpA family protein [Desulforhopalus singaporensis]|uniref:Membrane protein required for colicin V production n=1 Tax=Desulforhopalus singaporensis TaxID=91360 RepID=A0A1H0JM51_9BACT|nr:CvpA family protein [Desulforhopalus singaporensis]SDO44858.1 membrane protein required for colicin V production [Desulforhopalus singaporensis]